MQQLIRTERVRGSVKEWLPGYREELRAVEDRRLEVIENPDPEVVRKAVRMRMRLEAKKDGRRKGRLILQGFREPKSWDVGSNDSPVAAMATIRTLLFMAGLQGDVISSIDVSTAFLQSNEYPQDHEHRYAYFQPHKDGRRYYYRLKGCLYGQRSAPMAWYKTISEWLEGEGFVPGKNDPCVYVHPITGMRLAVVVDDIICRGSRKDTEAFYNALEARFQCKDPSYLEEGFPIKYVGLDIEQYTREGCTYISINQQTDVENYLHEIGFTEVGTVRNPMPSRHAISKYNQSADTRISKLRIQRWVFPEIKNLQRLASEASLEIAKFGNEITKFSNFARFLKR